MSFDIKKLLIDGKNIKLTFYNSFYNKAIPYRPLTDYEMELITAEATKVASESCGINKNEIKEIIEGNSTSSKSVNFACRAFIITSLFTDAISNIASRALRLAIAFLAFRYFARR